MTITMFATMDEIRNFTNHSQYTFHDVNLAQIYALYQMAGWSRSMIADHLGYAPSTVSTKRHYMWDYADLAEILFGDVAVEVEVEVAPITRTLYRTFKNGNPAVAMEFMPDCGEDMTDEEMVYFFKFFNADEIIFNKIGTTTCGVVSRLRDEIGDYCKKFPITRVEIHRMRSCGDKPAEGAESALRAEFIKRFGAEFRKNDRFFEVDIDPALFDEVLAPYLD